MVCHTTNASVTDRNRVIAVSRLPFNILLVCLLLVGIVGNSIAIHVCHRKQKRGNRFYILLLAVYDIIASVDTTISVLILNSYSVSFPSDVLCKVMTYFMWTTPSSSALMVLIIALQRFLLVFKPTKRYFDPRHHRIIVVLVVTFVPMVIAVPMCVFSGTAAINVSLSDESHLTTCSCEAKTGTFKESEESYIMFLFVLTLLLILTTTLLYAPVGFVILKKYKNSGSSQNPPEFQSNSIDAVETLTSDITDVRTAMREERRGNRGRPNVTLNFHMMFGVIVMTYLLTYIPTFTMILVQRQKAGYWLDLSGGKLTIFLLLRRFHMVSNVVNPFVYGYFDITFRSYYAAVFRSLFCCRSSSKTNCLRDRRSEETDTDNTYY